MGIDLAGGQEEMIMVEGQEEVRVKIQVEEIGEVNQEVQVSMEEGLVHIVEDQTEKEVIEEILVGIQEVMVEIGQEVRVSMEEGLVLVKVHIIEDQVLEDLQIKEEMILEVLEGVGEGKFFILLQEV